MLAVSMLGSSYRKINHAVGKAIHRYQMIDHEDRIAVGVSGGKDSLTLLWALKERSTRVPVRYSLFPVFVDPGFEQGFAEPLRRYCAENGSDLSIELSDCGIRGHSPENRENPCFLCSRLRRKRLFEAAGRLGCNKVALGHNQDDIIETLFLNMFYAGEMSTMVPSQPLFGGKLTVIRPLAMAGADAIRRFAAQQGFPDFHNPCPTALTSKRKEIKEMLLQVYRSNRKIRGNIFRAMSHVKTEYLLR